MLFENLSPVPEHKSLIFFSEIISKIWFDFKPTLVLLQVLTLRYVGAE